MTEKTKQSDGLTQAVNEQVLSCPICTEPYTAAGDQQPKSLPCHHSLCLQCVKILADKSRGTTIQCPTCRKVSNVPGLGGVSSIPNNYLILELLDIVKQHEDDGIVRTYSSRKRRAMSCCNCDKPTTETTCMGCDECDGVWCNECQRFHNESRIFKSHKFLSFDEYVDKAAAKSSVEFSRKATSATTPRCKTHISKDIDIYCVDCEEMVCYICFASGHSGHGMLLIEEAARLKAEKVAEIRGVVEARESSLESASVLIGRKSIGYERHVAGLEKKIRYTANQLRDVIYKREQEALSEVSKRTLGIMDRLAAERNHLKGLVGRVHESLKAADGAVHCDCAFDVCRSAPDVQDSLQALLAELEKEQEERKAEPCDSPRLAIVVADLVEELDSAAAHLFGIVDERSLSLDMPDVSSVAAAVAAIHELLIALRTAATTKLDLGSHCRITHVLDAIYSMAISEPSKPRELGAAQVCPALVGLLSCDGVRGDSVLTE